MAKPVFVTEWPDALTVVNAAGDTQSYVPDPRSLVRNTTLKEDLAMLSEPLTPNGGMNHCYADGYYARSLEKKWGAPIDELRRRQDA